MSTMMTAISSSTSTTPAAAAVPPPPLPSQPTVSPRKHDRSSNSENEHQLELEQHALNLELKLRKSCNIPNYLKKACAKAMLKHLLFVRRIIPFPPDEALEEYYNHMHDSGDGSGNGNGNGNGSGSSAGKGSADTYRNDNAISRSLGSALEYDGENGAIYDNQGDPFKIHIDHDNDDGSQSQSQWRQDQQNYHHRHQQRAEKRKAQKITNQKKRHDKSTHRKIIKFGEQLHTLLQDLDSMFGTTSTSMAHPSQNHHDCHQNQNDTTNHNTSSANDFESGVKAVLFTIGPSFNSPREQYILRFHSWPNNLDSNHSTLSSSSSNSNSISTPTPTPLPPPWIIEKLEKEIARRIVREFIRGIFENEEESNQSMFQINSMNGNNGGNLSTSNLKLNVACLVTKGESQYLFQHYNGNSATATATATATTTTTTTTTSVATTTVATTATNGTNALGLTNGYHNSVPINGFSLEQERQQNINSNSNNLKRTTLQPASLSSYAMVQQHSSSHNNKKRRLPQFTIQRDFVIKIPRTIRAPKKRKIHRPFVMMNIMPMMNPNQTLSLPKASSNETNTTTTNRNNNGSNTLSTANNPEFKMLDGDTWVSLKSTLKGFARKM